MVHSELWGLVRILATREVNCKILHLADASGYRQDTSARVTFSDNGKRLVEPDPHAVSHPIL